ncbi:MAG: hypothetical protein ACPGUV_06960 [Polyangiales bacterium]
MLFLRLCCRSSWVLVGLLGAACAQNFDRDGDRLVPRLLGIREDTAAVGKPVHFVGKDFIQPSEGWVDVHWRGNYIPDEGAPQAVDLTVPLLAASSTELVWPHFGLDRIPLHPTCERGGVCSPGTFEGEVFAVNRPYGDKPIKQPSSTNLKLQDNERFKVDRSIVVTEFRPFDDEEDWIADCSLPAKDAIGGLSYVFGIETVGFEADEIEYFIAGGGLQQGSRLSQEDFSLRYEPAAGSTDSHKLLLTLAPVPEFANLGYKMTIVVNARSGDRSYQLAYPFMVRKQVSYFPEGGAQIAEIYPPEPVDGCISGSGVGLQYTYTEAESVTRASTVIDAWAEGWQENYQSAFNQSFGESETRGSASSRTDSTTTTDARTDGGFDSGQEFANLSSGWSLQDASNFSLGTGGSNSAVSALSNALGRDAGFDKVNELAKIMQSAKQEVSQNQGVITSENTSTGAGRMGQIQQNGGAGASAAAGQNWAEMTSNSVGGADTTSQHRNRSENYANTFAESESVGRNFTDIASTAFTYSSSRLNSESYSVPIPGGFYGRKYRQQTRYVVRAALVLHDLCGNRSLLNTIAMDRYDWQPEIAVAPMTSSCTVPSCLPAAQCLIGPCDGNYGTSAEQRRSRNPLCERIQSSLQQSDLIRSPQ